MEYTTRLTSVRDLRTGATFRRSSLVYSVRSGWRRATSLAWNAVLARLLCERLAHACQHASAGYRTRSAIWRQITRLLDRLAETRHANDLSRLDCGTARDRATREPNECHEPLRSPHSFPLQRPLGGMALSPLRFSGQLLRSEAALHAAPRRPGWISSPSPITTRSTAACSKSPNCQDTFISEQVTTYFPQDPCKIHLLVWGITEAQHAEIITLRENIFDLQSYLQSEEIAHAVAHPLYSINGKLEATSHLERLILLFKHFEGNQRIARCASSANSRSKFSPA